LQKSGNAPAKTKKPAVICGLGSCLLWFGIGAKLKSLPMIEVKSANKNLSQSQGQYAIRAPA